METFRMLSDFLSLIYPSVCAACHTSLYKGETCLCTSCLYKLPETDFHLDPRNPVAEKFRGRVPLELAASCYHFNKGEKVQRLIHSLKYKGRKDIGLFLGRRYGAQLLSCPQLRSVDAVVAVPLHRQKQRRRGYNQSTLLGQGIAEAMDRPFLKDYLIRTRDAGTQTRQSQQSRWENVKDAFMVSRKATGGHQHLLLVDDVITTGSTLEACATTLLNDSSDKLSIVSLAYASL